MTDDEVAAIAEDTIVDDWCEPTIQWWRGAPEEKEEPCQNRTDGES